MKSRRFSHQKPPTSDLLFCVKTIFSYVPSILCFVSVVRLQDKGVFVKAQPCLWHASLGVYSADGAWWASAAAMAERH